eukprot:gene14027-16534_t
MSLQSKCLINGSIRSYSTLVSSQVKHTTFVPFATLGLNNHVSFGAPSVIADGVVVVKHTVSTAPFVPLGNSVQKKKEFTHTLTDAQIAEIQKLRPTLSQKALAEKFNTSKHVIARLARQDPAARQALIDNFQIRSPRQPVNVPERKSRVALWLAKNQQREYDLKVLGRASAFEDMNLFRRIKTQGAALANEETFDAMEAGKALLRSNSLNFDDDEEAAAKREKKKENASKSTSRRRKIITDKEKGLVNKAKKAKAKILSMMDD